MNIEAFQQLVRVLEEVRDQEKPFDFLDWFNQDDECFDDDDNLVSCETAACAVGWAVRDPWFQNAGLYAFGLEPAFMPTTPPKSFAWRRQITGWAAVSVFFDIPLSATYHLFSNSSYTIDDDIQSVIDRVKEFAEKEGQ